MLGAQELAPDRTGEEVLPDIGAETGREDGERLAQTIERDGGTSLEVRSRELGARGSV
jgi:hypothetical protein